MRGTDVSLFLQKDAHLSVLFVGSLPRNQTLAHDDIYDIEQSRIGLVVHGVHTYQGHLHNCEESVPIDAARAWLNYVFGVKRATSTAANMTRSEN